MNPAASNAGKMPWRQPPKVARVPGDRSSAGRFDATWSAKRTLAFLLAHAGLALVMKQVSAVAGLHAVVTLAVGLWIGLRNPRPAVVLVWCSYVVGAEVIWRMCHAPIPWEFGKHSIWLVCLVSLTRHGVSGSGWLPIVYCVLLVPAAVLTFSELPFDYARKQVSFYLSGPFELALAGALAAGLRLDRNGFRAIAIAGLAGVVGAGTIVLFGLTTTEVNFGTGSNAALSGGYGPNQVSSMLSLGAMLALFLFLGEERSLVLRTVFLGSGLWLLGQSALTFSRTGLYLFMGSVGLAGLFLVQWRQRGRRILYFALALVAIGAIAFPMMDAYTGGRLSDRFADKGLTGRDSIAKQDLEIWSESPVLGVGAGISMHRRGLESLEGKAPASHTEYTRLLADHGLLGILALALLISLSAQALWRAEGPWAKAVVIALASWAFLFMAGTAMRLAAPGFLLGLIQARFTTESMPSASAIQRGPMRVLTSVRRRWSGRPGP